MILRDRADLLRKFLPMGASVEVNTKWVNQEPKILYGSNGMAETSYMPKIGILYYVRIISEFMDYKSEYRSNPEECIDWTADHILDEEQRRLYKYFLSRAEIMECFSGFALDEIDADAKRAAPSVRTERLPVQGYTVVVAT